MNRDELERRAAEAMRISDDPSDERHPDDYMWMARAALDAIGLTEETVWTDDGNYDVWNRRVSYFAPDGGIYLDGHAEPATDDELREIGLVKQRRWVTPWEEITE